jgi:hypothetical protein
MQGVSRAPPCIRHMRYCDNSDVLGRTDAAVTRAITELKQHQEQQLLHLQQQAQEQPAIVSDSLSGVGGLEAREDSPPRDTWAAYFKEEEKKQPSSSSQTEHGQMLSGSCSSQQGFDAEWQEWRKRQQHANAAEASDVAATGVHEQASSSSSTVTWRRSSLRKDGRTRTHKRAVLPTDHPLVKRRQFDTSQE